MDIIDWNNAYVVNAQLTKDYGFCNVTPVVEASSWLSPPHNTAHFQYTPPLEFKHFSLHVTVSTGSVYFIHSVGLLLCIWY